MRGRTAQQISKQILEKNGGKISERAKVILLNDPDLKELHEPLTFISNTWRDLTSALMSLSCEVVGGRPEDITDAALALSLMNLSFTTWDDIIDHAKAKTFKPTLYGKFGQDIALIVGGIASAKAFTIISQSQLQYDKRKTITTQFWKLWSKMATAEATALATRAKGLQSSKSKLRKMKAEAINLATSLRIGSVIGGGSQAQVEHLFRYGKNLALITGLTLDFKVSVNSTVELVEKVRNNRLPYSILWASERSKSFETELNRLFEIQDVDARALNRFINVFLGSGIKDYLSKIANSCRKRGQLELSYLSENEAKQSLNALIDAHWQIFDEQLAVG